MKGRQYKKRLRESISDEITEDITNLPFNTHFDHMECMLQEYFTNVNEDKNTVKHELISMVKGIKNDMMEVMEVMEVHRKRLQSESKHLRSNRIHFGTEQST